MDAPQPERISTQQSQPVGDAKVVNLGESIGHRLRIAHEAERALVPVSRIAYTMDDLPKWDAVLNDAGRPLGARTRDREIAVLAITADVDDALASGKRPAVSVLATLAATNSPAYFALVIRIAAANYRIAEQITADKPSLLDVVWSEWATRGEVRVAHKQADSAAKTKFLTIAQDAHAKHTSDIHFFIQGGATETRFRIDGDALRQPYDMTAAEGVRVCSAVYNTMTESASVKHGFSMIERQDASIDYTFPSYRLRFRYAGSPNEPHGYHVALRIIPVASHQRLRALTDMGYARDTARKITAAFSRPHGLILFCGTTGSGKSTTIANEMGHLIRVNPTKIALTVEDPVEILIPGVHQSDVPKDQFNDALSSLMRQDPDVLMVGEVRGEEGANLAVQGVRTGHLLASTVHAGGSMICIDRLNGLGIAYRDLASPGIIAAIVFQVLVQTLCPHCRIPVRTPGPVATPAVKDTIERLREELAKGAILGASSEGDHLDGIYLRNPDGCEHCNHRGILGRQACAELFQPQPQDLPFLRAGDIAGLTASWRARRDAADLSNMTGRRAIEHAQWKMVHGVVSPVEMEAHFGNFGELIE